MLIGVAFAMFGPHIANGGFELDDWTWAADHERLGGFFANAGSLLRTALSYGGSRPGEALYFATTFSLFGSNAALHIALTIALAGLMSTAVFVVLRTLGMERLHSGAIALLVLLFPAADAPRLWPSAAYSQLAICLYAAGLVLSLRGFRAAGRSSLPWHAAGIACYGACVLTYEVAVGGLLLDVLLYRLRTGWRPSLRRWAFDLALLVPAVLYDHHTKGASLSPGHALARAHVFADEARTLLTRLGIWNGPARLPFVLVILVVVAAALVAFALPVSDVVRRPLRRWLAVCGGGVLAVVAGYIPFISTSSFYTPLRPGIGNRTNIAAATGYVVVIYALAVIAGYLVALAIGVLRRRDPAVSLASILAVGALVGVAALWAYRVDQDRSTWDRAEAVNRQTLTALRRAGEPPPRSTVYTFGAPGTTAPFVFTFSVSWDLTGALRLLWHDQTLHGVPSPSIEPTFGNLLDPSAAGNSEQNSGFVCRGSDVRPRGWLYYERDASPYGRTMFVDVPRLRSALVRDRHICRVWASSELN